MASRPAGLAAVALNDIDKRDRHGQFRAAIF